MFKNEKLYNAISNFYIYSIEKRYPPLARRLWRMIVEEFKVLVKTGNFTELSASQIILLLKDSKLNLDPSDELLVVSKWLEVGLLYMYFYC